MFYPTLIVHSGLEKVRVVRNKGVIFEGTMGAGFTLDLTVGDKVYTRTSNIWLYKFGIVVDRGKTFIKFSNNVGLDDRRHYVARLPEFPRRSKTLKVIANQRRVDKLIRAKRKIARNFIRGEGYIR